jgi:hypothetical protein
MFGCPLCVTAAELTGNELIKHILSDHPHEAAVGTTLLPILVAAFKGQWPWVVLGLIVIALLLADLQSRQKGEPAAPAAELPTALPVVYVPTVNLNVPIYGPHFPYRFYYVPTTILR